MVRQGQCTEECLARRSGRIRRLRSAELIVQSALSTSVKNLERELGAELFDRTGRRVVPTEAGLALVPAARAVLAGTEAARDAVSAVSGLHTARVRVGTIQTLACVDPAAELAVFHRLCPGGQISLREATTPDLIEAVRAGPSAGERGAHADQGPRRRAVRGLPGGHRPGDGGAQAGRPLRSGAQDHL
ncbi:LysR family transcriptional regulator [Streptomyces sp. NPDC007107]|uniref:LysR family transcriptional regulator n=1 Tax=Streptomyces sp. NPDC007107 TaxID=3156915 RepID=UPI0033E3E1FE